ncbi:related to acyltransferase, has a minor role in medium-chain fatty acid ethyl ester biosynthesis [Serendipita indica DSM 11827]|uniref:Related to acyltransferase, has a minor role in medium-chain fatty acid ethyl ester biosynthesis n=1 Tax=Serendipita indica (strain DSM 11827) TaxID=1109443 RepID=G4TD81_SERID|nr:related to acyltransferase, has a minor role in medium-chain fatty acid ethyl ester biosynthesis [Serendipita indica DSM 11827]
MFPFNYLTRQSAETTIHSSPQTVSIQTKDGSLSILDFTKKYAPAVLSRFQPAWWLPNGHAQTAYCATGNFENIDRVQYQRKYLRLPDGGTIGIDFTPPLDAPLPADTPIIVVEHGLTGGSHESYVRNILAAACAPKDQNGLGYRAAVINFRGCAGVPITSPRFYSAACTEDLACGALYISTLFPEAKLVGIGFSLGANVITRYLGEEGKQSRLNGGLALACPWNLVENSKHLEGNWFSRHVYSSAMGNNLLRLYKSHLHTLETFKDTHLLKVHPNVLKLKSPKLIDIDHVLVSQTGGAAPVWPFPSALEYYQYASSDHALPGIAVPYLAISAQDDPIVRLIPRPDDPKTEASGWVAVAITERGGHLGWFEDGEQRGEVRRWISKPALEWIRAVAEEFVREDGQGGRPIEVVDGFTREIGRPMIGFREIDEKDLPKGANAEGLTKGL